MELTRAYPTLAMESHIVKDLCDRHIETLKRTWQASGLNMFSFKDFS